MNAPRRIDEAAAREAFELALAGHEQAFGRFFLAKLFGMDISFPDGTCRVALTPRDFMFNPQGWLHGGVVATVMDISMGHLLAHTVGPGTTLEMKTQYLKAVGTEPLVCTGRYLRRGRGICYLAAELTDAKGEVAAFATSTWKVLKPAT
jgi:acyl-CoA thioesterase